MTEMTAFDTHRFVKNLTASGFTEAQAEALAEEHVHLLNSNLATKADLGEVRKDLAMINKDQQVEIQTVKKDLEIQIQTVKKDLEIQIQTVKKDLQVEIQTVKADLLKWMITAMVAQVGLIVALIRLL